MDIITRKIGNPMLELVVNNNFPLFNAENKIKTAKFFGANLGANPRQNLSLELTSKTIEDINVPMFDELLVAFPDIVDKSGFNNVFQSIYYLDNTQLTKGKLFWLNNTFHQIWYQDPIGAKIKANKLLHTRKNILFNKLYQTQSQDTALVGDVVKNIFSLTKYGQLNQNSMSATKMALDLLSPELKNQWLREELSLLAQNPQNDEKKAIVKFLIEKDDNCIYFKDQSGNTLLHYAATESTEILSMLLENGFDPNTINAYGKTALYFAAQSGHIESAKILIGAGADITAQDEDLNTAAHAAAKNYVNIKTVYANLIKILTDQEKFDLDLKNEEGKTVFGCWLDDYSKQAFKSLYNKPSEDFEEDSEGKIALNPEEFRHKNIFLCTEGIPLDQKGYFVIKKLFEIESFEQIIKMAPNKELTQMQASLTEYEKYLDNRLVPTKQANNPHKALTAEQEFANYKKEHTDQETEEWLLNNKFKVKSFLEECQIFIRAKGKCEQTLSDEQKLLFDAVGKFIEDRQDTEIKSAYNILDELIKTNTIIADTHEQGVEFAGQVVAESQEGHAELI